MGIRIGFINLRSGLITLFVLFFIPFTQSPGGIDAPDAGEKASYLTPLEQGVLKELNMARTSPHAYSFFLRELSGHFRGRALTRPGGITVMTKEGEAAVNEAIRFLEKTEPIKPLGVSSGMSRGARDHVRGQGSKGAVGHTFEDGIGPGDRVNRYGTWEKILGENISYGPAEAREVVMSLIIDDGVPNRGHRENIFNPDFHVIGIACGPHAAFKMMCVMTFAGGYREESQ